MAKGSVRKKLINQKSIKFYGGTLWNSLTLLWMFFRLS